MKDGPDGMEEPFLLKTSTVRGFAAGRSSVSDTPYLEARYRFEDNLITTMSIPQGSVHIWGNISPGTDKQQGVAVILDSSDFGSVLALMMKANPKRTIAAIASVLASCSDRWPDRHWDALGD